MTPLIPFMLQRCLCSLAHPIPPHTPPCWGSPQNSLPLEHHHFVGLYVAQVQLLALLYHIWVLAHQQPANVGEEKAPHGVVGVCICLGEFVVDTMVPDPLVDVILQGKGSRDLGPGLEMIPSK